MYLGLLDTNLTSYYILLLTYCLLWSLDPPGSWGLCFDAGFTNWFHLCQLWARAWLVESSSRSIQR